MKKGPKTLEIEQVQENFRDEGSHQIVSIKGLPFYQSSGSHSAFPGTWFPFFGIDETGLGHFGKHWAIKSFQTALPLELRKKINDLFPSYGSDAAAGRDLLLRFWNVPCLLLSSSLGGGLWQEARGKSLKQFLESLFPAYYLNMPVLNRIPKDVELNSIKDVNQWLCGKLQVVTVQEIKPRFPKDLTELEAILEVSLHQRKSLRLAKIQAEKERAILERAPTLLLDDPVASGNTYLPLTTQAQIGNNKNPKVEVISTRKRTRAKLT
jgi:hypothetical protein